MDVPSNWGIAHPRLSLAWARVESLVWRAGKHHATLGRVKFRATS
jgi:hypothetical protein